MEFMKSLILENASGELSTHSPQASPGRHEPAITKSKSKPSFKTALSPSSPHCQKELQFHIIKLALQIGKVVVVNYHPGGKGRGWWSDLHPYLRVNRIFRDETLRLRPKSFAHFEKLKEGEETQESEDKEGCEGEKGGQGSKRTVKKPRMIEPPQIDFDFSCDVLAVDLPNLKSIALISGTSFDHGRGRVGPFSEEENYARPFGVKQIEVCKAWCPEAFVRWE
ncbi:hypothetical protein V8E51_010889 [Hyaloscypha variabilis]